MAKSSTPNLDLDGPPPAAETKSVAPVVETAAVVSEANSGVARQGDDGRPYCEKHQCLMRANGTGPEVTYYACPVPGCGCKQKKIRPQYKMAAEPHACPHQTCREPVQYLEAKDRQPLVSVVVMKCPNCGFEMQQPRAQFRPKQYGKDDLSSR